MSEHGEVIPFPKRDALVRLSVHSRVVSALEALEIGDTALAQTVLEDLAVEIANDSVRAAKAA